MADDERRSLHRRAGDGEIQLRILLLEEGVKYNAAHPSAEMLEVLDRRYSRPTTELLERLDKRYMSRDELAREYVPRAEHERSRDWTLRIALAVLTVIAVIEPIALKLIGS